MSEPLMKPLSASAASPMSASDRLAPIARAVLRGAARGLCSERGGFQAAELWLLDDASRTLGLAARWAKKGASLADAPEAKRRDLANAPADVAALSGGAVVFEDPSEAAGWDPHTPGVGSALCLPVSSESTIHGVLWLVSDKPMTIADEAVELAEIVAGRLALEVERSAATQDILQRAGAAIPTPPATPESKPDARFDAASSARVAPVEAAAWNASHTEGLSDAACWELPEGRLIGLAVAAIDSPDSTTATQRSAVQWLMEEAREVAPHAADAGILLTLLNRRLQDSPLAGEGLAVSAALIDAPEDAEAGIGGVGTYAFAGPAIALSVRAGSTDSHVGELVPLGWTEPESAYASRPFELAIRQRLVLTAGDPRITSPLVERRVGDVYRAATADAHREMTAEGCLRRLAASGADDVLAAVALRRE